MVKCSFLYDKKGPVGFSAEGHALTAPYGKDLVCAGVSAVLLGGINAFDEEGGLSYKVEEGKIEVLFKEEPSIYDRHVMMTLEAQIKSLAVSYPEAVALERKQA